MSNSVRVRVTTSVRLYGRLTVISAIAGVACFLAKVSEPVMMGLIVCTFLVVLTMHSGREFLGAFSKRQNATSARGGDTRDHVLIYGSGASAKRVAAVWDACGKTASGAAEHF